MSTSTSRYVGAVNGLDALRLLLELLHERRGLLGDVVLGLVLARGLRVEGEVEQGLPAELEARLRERVVPLARAGARS